MEIPSAERDLRSTVTKDEPFLQSPKPYPNYPIPIPSDKLAKAIKLYKKYRIEVASKEAIRSKPPGTRPSRSESSVFENATTTSISTRSSNQSAIEGELVAFNGFKVRQRVRKPLTPIAKTKAALVRYLGPCRVCLMRRVSVSCTVLSHSFV